MKFYRYEWHSTTGYKEFLFNLKEYDLIKETDKGYWIGFNEWAMKWVPKNSLRRYAYPTKEEAMRNFIKRTEKRIQFLQHTLMGCEFALNEAKKLTASGRKDK